AASCTGGKTPLKRGTPPAADACERTPEDFHAWESPTLGRRSSLIARRLAAARRVRSRVGAGRRRTRVSGPGTAVGKPEGGGAYFRHLGQHGEQRDAQPLSG